MQIIEYSEDTHFLDQLIRLQ